MLAIFQLLSLPGILFPTPLNLFIWLTSSDLIGLTLNMTSSWALLWPPYPKSILFLLQAQWQAMPPPPKVSWHPFLGFPHYPLNLVSGNWETETPMFTWPSQVYRCCYSSSDRLNTWRSVPAGIHFLYQQAHSKGTAFGWWGTHLSWFAFNPVKKARQFSFIFSNTCFAKYILTVLMI